MSSCTSGTPFQNFGKNINITPFQTCTPTSLEDLVAAVQQAESLQFHAHAFGSKWSFSDCAVTADFMVDTTQLNHLIPAAHAVQKALVPDTGDPDLFVHVEAGIRLQDFNTILDQLPDSQGTMRPRALLTMPGSSTMTIAGAISTGSHGGDIWQGPLADTIAAIHLVGAGGTQYWIEPSSGITDPARLRQFVAPGVLPDNIIYDTSIFDSMLVSVGCMGIIYSVVVRVRDQYGLIETTTQSDWQSFKASAPRYLNDPTIRFLEVIVDPYPDENGLHPCLIQTRVEAPVAAASAVGSCQTGNVEEVLKNTLVDLFLADPVGPGAVIAGSAVASLLAGTDYLMVAQGALNDLITKAPNLRSVVIKRYPQFLTTWVPPGTCGNKGFMVMDQKFRNPPGADQIGGDSIEITFQSVDVEGRMPFVEFVDVAISAINAATNTLLVGWLALRFTGSTRAALGMQQWTQNCAVELSTLPNIQGLPELLRSLLDTGYRMGGKPHWGQRNEGLLEHGNATIYPALPMWRAAYARLSDNFQKRTFENPLSVRWLLTTPNIDVLEVSPSALSFGNVAVNNSTTQDIVITNVSFMNLSISLSIQAGGAFSVEPPSGNLAHGQSLTAHVTFSPASAGTAQDQLIVSTGIWYMPGPPPVPLSAIGVVRPAKLVFVDVPVRGVIFYVDLTSPEPDEQVISLKNLGSEPVEVTGVHFVPHATIFGCTGISGGSGGSSATRIAPSATVAVTIQLLRTKVTSSKLIIVARGLNTNASVSVELNVTSVSIGNPRSGGATVEPRSAAAFVDNNQDQQFIAQPARSARDAAVSPPEAQLQPARQIVEALGSSSASNEATQIIVRPAAAGPKGVLTLPSGRRVVLNGAEALVGRGALTGPDAVEVDLTSESEPKSVSRRHARIMRAVDGFEIEDLESANQTLLNHEPLQPHRRYQLHHGDVIEFGKVQCAFTLE